MKVSVIIPVYNCEKYIDRCLSSVLKQTYRDLEIILVNDGSTDQSGMICDRYVEYDSRVRVFHKKNGGVSSARNLGLDNSSGEAVLFVDADDYIFDSHIETLVQLYHKTKANVVITSYIKKKYNTTIKRNLNNNNSTMILSGNEAVVDMFLMKHFDSSVCCKLIVGKRFNNIRFDENLIVAEDMFYFYQLFLNTDRVAFSDIHEYVYVQYKSSANNSFSKKKIKSLDIFEYLISISNTKSIKESIKSKYISTCFHFLSMDGLDEESKKDLVYRIKKYRYDTILSKCTSIKVRLAVLLSYINYDLVIYITMKRDK